MDNVYSNSKGFLTAGRALVTLATLAVLVLVFALIALALGSEPISLGSVLRGSLTREQEAIIYGLRLPRIGLALCVGGALAVSGASFQSLLRNPLADPTFSEFRAVLLSDRFLESCLPVIFHWHGRF